MSSPAVNKSYFSLLDMLVPPAANCLVISPVKGLRPDHNYGFFITKYCRNDPNYRCLKDLTGTFVYSTFPRLLCVQH